jgi:hypothetical protein
MFSTFVVSLVGSIISRRSLRSTLGLAGAVALIAATAPVQAQTEEQKSEPRTGWGLHVTEGTLVPTGVQRDVVSRAHLTAAQISYVVRPAFALRSTIGWARSRDIALGGDARLDVFTYDIGGEVRGRQWGASSRKSFTPFVGGGAGARTYNHRDLAIDAIHDTTAYISAGAELGVRRVRLRFDVRDYVSGFKSLSGTGPTNARNDVVVMTSLRLVGR